MSTTLIGNNFKGWNDDGTPAAGAYLYTYASGTTTPLATYTDATLGTPNANPVVLNSRGEANVWLGPSTYSLKLTTNTGTQIGSTIDGVTSIDGLISASAATIEALYSAATGSTLIGYKASFTGAIQRTVQSKLSDFTSATDASVDTTGVTDCHAAIQAAINSGADVRLPPARTTLARAV